VLDRFDVAKKSLMVKEIRPGLMLEISSFVYRLDRLCFILVDNDL
jgi:hypothetical protein